MNINLGLTRNYKNDSPADPAKTKPILPDLKRQLYRIFSSTHLLIYSSTRLLVHAPASSRDTPTLPHLLIYSSTHLLLHALAPNSPPVFVLLPLLQSRRRLPARQFLPHQTLHFNAKIFIRFTHLANLFERNFTPFCKFLFTFCNFSHFETLFNTPIPHFQPKIKGDPAPVNFPNPIFSPKTSLRQYARRR